MVRTYSRKVTQASVYLVRYPGLAEKLASWYNSQKAVQRGGTLSHTALKSKAAELARQLGYREYKPSNSNWLWRFKMNHGIPVKRRNPETVPQHVRRRKRAVLRRAAMLPLSSPTRRAAIKEKPQENGDEDGDEKTQDDDQENTGWTLCFEYVGEEDESELDERDT